MGTPTSLAPDLNWIRRSDRPTLRTHGGRSAQTPLADLHLKGRWLRRHKILDALDHPEGRRFRRGVNRRTPARRADGSRASSHSPPRRPSAAPPRIDPPAGSPGVGPQVCHIRVTAAFGLAPAPMSRRSTSGPWGSTPANRRRSGAGSASSVCCLGSEPSDLRIPVRDVAIASRLP